MLSTNNIAMGIGVTVTVALVASCAGSPGEVIVSFVPATTNSYELRDELPRISTLTDGELIAGGHVNLGTATATQVVEKCWDRSRKCESGTPSVSVTTALLTEAMDQGADIVVLTANRETSYEPVEKRGQCLKVGLVCTPAQGRSYPPCKESKTHVCDPTHPNERCEKACAIYEKITGSVRIETSSGTLWRNQPQ